MTTTRPDFSHRLSALATAPGVYVMKNAAGYIIYVGKAQSLRNRVSSYFQLTRGMDPKTRELVSHIADFEVIRTDTDTEALILENELIKKHQPKYNVRLKDNKTYPHIQITNEEWPRIISTRRIVKDGSDYFGPYTSASAAYDTINLLNRLFPYRKCDKTITGKESVCLYYHMHQCTAPCIGAADRETYMQAIEGARMFLEGRGDEIIAALEDEMAGIRMQAPGRLKIGADAIAQGLGLADIDDVPGGVLHQVDAGGCGQGREAVGKVGASRRHSTFQHRGTQSVLWLRRFSALRCGILAGGRWRPPP